MSGIPTITIPNSLSSLPSLLQGTTAPDAFTAFQQSQIASAVKAAATATPSSAPAASASTTTPNQTASFDQINASTSNGNSSGTLNTIASNDYRIRLKPLVSAVDQVLGGNTPGNILQPLYATSGLLFPYSPQITFTQDIMYQDVSLVHSNSDILAYQRTPSVSLSINGKFTVQNQNEGAYALACIHFLRTVSKMYFGQNDPNRGVPPPILVLNGYGSYMFNNLKVILKSHTFTYEEQMDTVLVKTAGGTARLPALFTLGITLVVQQTPRALRQDFNLNAFRTGALMQTGGWI
ncbi:unnamed protein product [Sphagnum tenellum]